MKRPSVQEDSDEPGVKRVRKAGTKHHALKYRQPGARHLAQSPQDHAVVQEELTRAICTTLHYVGFDGATKNALEGFSGVLQEYILHFVWRVKQSMQQCRRSKPIPHDFVNALATFSLSASSFETDLNLPIPPAATLQPLELSQEPDFDSMFQTRDLTTVSELSDLEASQQSRHIPKHFPKLPSSHTYKDTPRFSEREEDPRKIREKATEEGVLAEQALRKLMVASKAGRAQMLRSRAQQDERWKKEEEMFREAMDDLGEEYKEIKEARKASNKEDLVVDADGEIAEEDAQEREQGVAVNYERVYWRNGGRGHAL